MNLRSKVQFLERKLQPRKGRTEPALVLTCTETGRVLLHLKGFKGERIVDEFEKQD